jgi:hypothetical protein
MLGMRMSAAILGYEINQLYFSVKRMIYLCRYQKN